jgi:hypothetical protein
MNLREPDQYSFDESHWMKRSPLCTFRPFCNLPFPAALKIAFEEEQHKVKEKKDEQENES